jgi:hypothetical protein
MVIEVYNYTRWSKPESWDDGTRRLTRRPTVDNRIRVVVRSKVCQARSEKQDTQGVHLTSVLYILGIKIVEEHVANLGRRTWYIYPALPRSRLTSTAPELDK